jgi:pilus assembly protein CpaB
MRAVAVRVDEVVGVSGFVLPGMRVDILSSGTAGASGTITRTILQNIEVLSAGQNLERDTQGRPATVQAVNLLVTPQDAEKLSLASAQMKIQLVLRNPLDVAAVKTSGISASGLLLDAPVREASPARPAPAPRPVVRVAPVLTLPAPEKPPAPLTVEVIHGAKKESVAVVQFDEARK